MYIFVILHVGVGVEAGVRAWVVVGVGILVKASDTHANICKFSRHHRGAAAEGRGPPLVSIPLAYVGMRIGCFDQDLDPDPNDAISHKFQFSTQNRVFDVSRPASCISGRPGAIETTPGA